MPADAGIAGERESLHLLGSGRVGLGHVADLVLLGSSVLLGRRVLGGLGSGCGSSGGGFGLLSESTDGEETGDQGCEQLVHEHIL